MIVKIPLSSHTPQKGDAYKGRITGDTFVLLSRDAGSAAQQVWQAMQVSSQPPHDGLTLARVDVGSGAYDFIGRLRELVID